MKRLLSFDVGIANLAYCILEVDHVNETFKIEKWDIVNLANNRKNCSFIMRNGKTCNGIATRVIKLNNENSKYFCSSHVSKTDMGLCPLDADAEKKKKSTCSVKKCKQKIKFGIPGFPDTHIGWCGDHFDKDDFKKYLTSKTKKISQNCNKIPISQLGLSMFQKLDQIPELLDVDEVYIENQPGLINPTMKSISAFLYSYFLIKGLHEKDKTGSMINNVFFCSPSKKIKIGGDHADIQIKTAGKDKVYKITKNIGKKLCLALINDNKYYCELFNSHRKKDDLADCLLQGIISGFPKIPKHYADKIDQFYLNVNA